MRFPLMIALFFVAALLSPSGFASDTASYHVSISAGNLAGDKIADTVDVILDSHGGEVAALDIKVATTSTNFEISQVLRGAIGDSCNWEFFNAKRLRDIESLGLSSPWQIVALADMLPDSVKPVCYGWKSPGSIARLVLTRKHEPAQMAIVDTICFLWQDCSDNSISDRNGVVLAISTLPDTSGFSGKVPMSLDFPNTTAASGSCIKPDKRDRVKRLIDFVKGEVRYVSDTLEN